MKNPKKTNFFGEFSERHVSFSRILILIKALHPSRRGSNFCRFLASDVEKITIFWESTLCEIIAFFRTRQSLCKTKFQKKLLFWGIFPDVFFIMFPFFWLCFYIVLSGWSTTSGWAAEKAKKYDVFSASEKMTFFRVRQYGAFWLQRSHCGDGYHIFPPTGLNLESAEISTSKLANSKQQMSKSIQQFLKCTLIRLPDDGPKKYWLSGWLAIWLAGWLSSWLAIWLTRWLRWLAGYLAIGFVAAWLAIWLLVIWLGG